MKTILTVFGNRPQFIKAGVVSRAIEEHGAGWLKEVTVHTGQHYDAALSDDIFRDLGMRKPDHHLGLGSGPLLDQIGKMLPLLREVVEQEKPDAILAYGDTNSTAAAAITAGHLDLPFIHIEAGERNFRRKQAPEEINRMIADHLCSIALVSTRKAARYLTLEGFHPDRVKFVGDTMLELFLRAQSQLEDKRTVSLEQYGVTAGEFYLATIHRAENTDDRDHLVRLMDALDSQDKPVLLPAHPRTQAALKNIGWTPKGSLKLFDPVGYFDILYLAHNAKAAITDSGGLSKEAFFAGIPVIIPLPNSGWREIVEQGWATVIPEDFSQIAPALKAFENLGPRSLEDFGDGESGRAIVEALKDFHWDVTQGEWHVAGTFDQVSSASSTRAWRLDTLHAATEPTTLLVRGLAEGDADTLAGLMSANANLSALVCVGAETVNLADASLKTLMTLGADRVSFACEPGFEAALQAFVSTLSDGDWSVRGVEGAGQAALAVDGQSIVGSDGFVEAQQISAQGQSELEMVETAVSRVHQRAAELWKVGS